VIVLAIDTATPSVTAGVVRLDRAAPPEPLAVRTTVDARAHGELLSPHVRDALADAGLGIDRVDAVVCGTGPGPFTGLRVGMVTAASLGHALGRPVHGVCTLDAIAHDAHGTSAGPLAVVTDARRREIYWAVYDPAGQRLTDPDVLTPAAVAERLPEFGVTATAGEGATRYADVLGLPVIAPEYPSPVGLVAVVAPKLLAGAPPDEFRPLYLRRPDAVEPGARKRVTAGQAGGP
jgi:tRNA threonylcarbamoyl adenosine modification protein YeaZ